MSWATSSARRKTYNPGTWPRTACRLTLHGYRSKTGDGVISLRQTGKSYLIWYISPDEDFSGGDLVLDGIEKTNSYDGGGIPQGTMRWTEYPFLKPGQNRLMALGCEIDGAEVEWEPGYV